MAAQKCERAMGEEHCTFHPDEKVIFECQGCDGVLACILCVGTVHKSHAMVSIKQAGENKLMKIEQFIKQTKENTIPNVEDKIQKTIHTLQESEVKFQKEIQKVKKQENLLKELVERYSGTKVSRLEHLLKDTTDLLKGHKGSLENLKQKMKKDTQECKQTVKTGLNHGVLVHDTEKQIVQRNATVSIPSVPPVTLPPNFTPCEDPNAYINMVFGDFDLQIGESEERQTARSVSDTYTFLDQPKLLYEYPTSYTVRFNSICCTPNNNTWSLDNGGALHLQQTLMADIKLERICINATTNEMFGVSKNDKSIRKVCTQTGRTSVMFKTESTPLNIGITNGNHFVVGMEDYRVRMFSFTGQVLHTYKHTGKYYPKISVCSYTSKVALTGHRDDVVTILDCTLKQLYEYKRQGTKSTAAAKFLGMNNTGKFNTAAFLGRYLLVGDRINSNILVLDKDTLVRTVSTKEMSHVFALSVQENGVLHVECSDPSKLLKIKVFE